MSEKTNLAAHPAFLAWREIYPQARVPKRIEELNLKKSKSTIFRLYESGPDKRNIIVKGGNSAKLKYERFIYEKILPKCSFSFLNYYGFVELGQKNFSWLFLEDAQGVDYISTNKDHRKTLITWLSALHHSSLPNDSISLLSDRSLKYYYNITLETEGNIRNGLEKLNLPKEYDKVLHSLCLQLNLILEKWEEIESFYNPIPLSFIHGDFKSGNLKIRKTSSKYQLMPFDWEMAGWGLSSIDLGSMRFDFEKADIELYCTLMQIHPEILNKNQLLTFNNLGRMLRLCISIYWLTFYFPQVYIPSRVLKTLIHYQKKLENILSTWGY